ncbi:hypothetical protein [Phenylobacterium sp.]|uniref:hypothetical protein n=1 Tax=Phenylobacterium sp. TaxID=1871053 RepID=UPI00281115B7|nr:hypothetical protein [Phenylobacterium sp.]
MTVSTAASLHPPKSRQAALASVALAGLAGGAVDFVYAGAIGLATGRTVERVWQSVAAAVIGKPAFSMGWTSATLGIVIHLAIATAMAAAFAIAAGRLPALYRRPWTSGAVYGLGLYAVMYGVVLPLRWPTVFPRWDGLTSVFDVLAHIGVGLAIVFVLRARTRAAP